MVRAERPVRTIDVDLACWRCEAAFERALVERDAQLVPRRRAEGGPFLLYACPECGRPSRVERNRAGALLASPTPIVPLADALVAVFDADTRADLARKREHLGRRLGRRTWFFGAYAEELWAAGIRPERAAEARRPAGARPPPRPRPEPAGSAPPPPESPPPPPEPPPPEPTPHEVLGLEPEAGREEAERAFRELAKRYHPDRFEALDEEFRALAHRKFIQLKAALDAFPSGGQDSGIGPSARVRRKQGR